jgi:predicted metal-dependent phosphoesterase TrpH
VDVHVLGYFVDVQSAPLAAFLTAQRRERIGRVREMIERLAAHGIHLDADAILQPALDDATRSAGRPWIARALVSAGHVASTNEAFERWLSHGRPAFVPRRAARPEDVIARIHEAGGVASLAHPALVARDEWIDGFAADGLDAIEVYHTDHDADATARYLAYARRLDLAVSGGSDFHGDDTHGGQGPGSVALPRDDFQRLTRLAAMRATASGRSTSS